QHRLPAIYSSRADVAAGGLLAYAADQLDRYRGAASYVDRILRGAKVSELPVQFPTKFELVVNVKTAKAIGLTIPEAFLLRADELIELVDFRDGEQIGRQRPLRVNSGKAQNEQMLSALPRKRPTSRS